MACSNISCCVISGTVNLIDVVLCTMPHQLLGVRLWIVCSTDLLDLLFSLPPIPYFLCMLYVFANWPSDCLPDCMVACFACTPPVFVCLLRVLLAVFAFLARSACYIASFLCRACLTLFVWVACLLCFASSLLYKEMQISISQTACGCECFATWVHLARVP